ncbi:hypothetical protein CFP56_027393 [Quercus suber]|uniref:Uncharacterized protein n=1 Tax=Quercus suber TaxID=58331 RepID=A0AAW0LY83_QUESU
METCKLQPPLHSPPIIGVSSKKANSLPIISRFPKHLGLQLAKQNLPNEAEKDFEKKLGLLTTINCYYDEYAYYGIKQAFFFGLQNQDDLNNQSL